MAMRHKWLLAVISVITLVSLVPATTVLNTDRIQITAGCRVLVWESMLVIERAGRSAISLPLCLIGWTFCGLLSLFYIALTFRNPNKPGGFEVPATNSPTDAEIQR